MPSSGANLLRNLSVMLLLVVVGFGAYYFTWIEKQDHRLTEHHFRLLLNSGEYVSDALEGLLGNVQGALSVSDDELRHAADVTGGALPDTIAKALGAKLELIPDFDVLPTKTFGTKPLGSYFDDPTIAVRSKPITQPPKSLTRLSVVLDDPANAQKLVFL